MHSHFVLMFLTNCTFELNVYDWNFFRILHLCVACEKQLDDGWSHGNMITNWTEISSLHKVNNLTSDVKFCIEACFTHLTYSCSFDFGDNAWIPSKRQKWWFVYCLDYKYVMQPCYATDQKYTTCAHLVIISHSLIINDVLIVYTESMALRY